MEDLPQVLMASPREFLVMHLQFLAMLRNNLLVHVGAMPTDLPVCCFPWVKVLLGKVGVKRHTDEWHDLLKMTGIQSTQP